MSPLEMSGDALALRARDILATAGLDEPAADTLDGFWAHDAYINFIVTHDEGPSLYERLPTERPGALRYWYRQSPAAFVPLAAGSANWLNPPMQIPGSSRVVLDTRGSLLDLWIVPRRDWIVDSQQDIEWPPLFAAARLDISAFEPVPAEWNRSVNTDTRLAWRGTYPDSRGLQVAVEAGAFAGRAVHFRVVFPWSAAERGSPAATGLEVAGLIGSIWFAVTLIGAAMIARRNMRLGRGDRRGSLRLAVLTAALWFAAWLAGAHHVPTAAELDMFLEGTANALVLGCLVWVFYMAIEPS